MLSRLIQLLTLVAVLMLPLGMAHASAPSPMADHHAMAGMGTVTPGHCDGMPPAAPTKSDHQVPDKCAMACASSLPALPTVGTVSAEPKLRHPAFATPRTAALHGLILDIATPPPRHA